MSTQPRMIQHEDMTHGPFQKQIKFVENMNGIVNAICIISLVAGVLAMVGNEVIIGLTAILSVFIVFAVTRAVLLMCETQARLGNLEAWRTSVEVLNGQSS